MASLSEVRDLKRRWYNLTKAKPTGFGLLHIGGGGGDGWALKVSTELKPEGDVPTQLDGIPLVVEHIGEVTAAAVEYDLNPT